MRAASKATAIMTCLAAVCPATGGCKKMAVVLADDAVVLTLGAGGRASRHPSANPNAPPLKHRNAATHQATATLID